MPCIISMEPGHPWGYFMLTAYARSGTTRSALVVLLLLALLPFSGLSTHYEFVLTVANVYAIAAVGLDVFSGYAGQISIGHFAFVGIGAYSWTILYSQAHLSVGLAFIGSLIVSGLVAIVAGAALVRLGQFGAALTTFFLAFVLVNVLSGQTFGSVTHGVNGLAVPPVELFGQDLESGSGLYYSSWAILAVVSLLALRYVNSRTGRALRLAKHNDEVAAVLGVRPTRLKFQAFVFSALIASAAGPPFALSLGFLSPGTFDPTESIDLLAMGVVGGLGSISGPILGALGLELLPDITRGLGQNRALFFAFVLLVALIFFRDGLYGLLDRLLRFRKGKREPGAHVVISVAKTDPLPADPPCHHRHRPKSAAALPPAAPALEVQNVNVTFGGIQALSVDHIRVAKNSVHAIIGPNGAGKTTLLNYFSGLQSAPLAVMRCADAVITDRQPRAIRKLGILRTFQQPSLVPDLSVRENVQLGRYGGEAGGLMGDLFGHRGVRARDRATAREAEAALDLIQFPESRRDRAGRDLSLGELKAVDVARAIAAAPTLLLMDEPDSGLDQAESNLIANIIRSIMDETQITIVLISHHVAFVQKVADEVSVLHSGSILTTGSPAGVTDDPRVIEVFLGA